MTTETLVCLCTVGLAMLHLLSPALFGLANNGLSASLGTRDALSPTENKYGQRLDRANNNFKETLPLALGLLILVQLVDKQGGLSATGAWIYLSARLVYIPLYVFGVPFVRTIAWATSIVGLGLIAIAIL